MTMGTVLFGAMFSSVGAVMMFRLLEITIEKRVLKAEKIW